MSAWFDDFLRDVRYAVRTLRKNPGFAAVAILTLALGIGANTAIFSLVHAVLLRALPFADPDRLVVVWEDRSRRGGPSTVQAAPATYTAWRDQNHVFEGIAAVDGVLQAFNLTGDGDPERLSGAKVTSNLFSILGLRPIVGRTLLAEDDRPDANPVVVMSEGLWRRRFGADPSIVGRSIRLNDTPHAVVGVVPGHFQFPTKGTDVWIAPGFTPAQLARRGTYYLDVVARLKRGVSLAQAQADMSVLAKKLEEQYPDTNTRVGVNVVPLHEQFAGAIRPTMTILLAVVGVVLLIACVNVANLLLARGANRRREIAVRGALGAARGRVIRQLITESLVLACAGAMAGALLATGAFRFLTRLIPEHFPDQTTLSLDPVVLFFTATVAIVTGVGFGVGPSMAMSRLNVHDALKQSGARGSTRRERGVRSALVVAEVALTVVLLIAAGLLLRSHAAVTSVDVGFPSRGLFAAEIPLSPSRYADTQRRSAFVSQVVERIGSLPGVTSVGSVNHPPLVFKGGRTGFAIEGRTAPGVGEFPQQVASDRAVSAQYFPTMGIPLRRGRQFDNRDIAGAPAVVMINETMARRFWGTGDPIGQRIRIGGGGWMTITGVIGDVHQMGLEVPAEPELYLPFAQAAPTTPFFWPRYLMIRAAGDPSHVASAVRAAVASVDPDQPVASVRTMDDVIDQELAGRTTQLTLVGGFSVLALLLAAVGLYGVLAYAVAQQTPEIGLRMALGASRAQVVQALVRRTLALTSVGVLIGLAAAAAITRALSSFLYGVSPTDPIAFVGVSVLLVAVALAACWAPARRATRINPLTALRSE